MKRVDIITRSATVSADVSRAELAALLNAVGDYRLATLDLPGGRTAHIPGHAVDVIVEYPDGSSITDVQLPPPPDPAAENGSAT